ncbi:MAG: Rieske 2Fe-2S domain-containing protein [Chloroflexales bacterium]|nr:Rieske 2Fe-2S domain-containing protein [Chloroflexales bacterium]
MTNTTWINVAQVTDFETVDHKVVSAGDRPVLLLRHVGRFYALDNRCPHMGFPLDKGSVSDCILTCHWHHARFDLASGGTFDQFADDVRAYPVEQRGDALWIDLAPRHDPRTHQLRRLRDGLERTIRLVTAKAAIALLSPDGASGDPREPLRVGLAFGIKYRANGWGQGLTMLTCFMNMLPKLDPEDRARALYQGLDAVSVEAAGTAPRFMIDPLPTTSADLPTLKRWFRRFIAVRDDEGAERCIVSAVRAGATSAEMADILFAAITDYRYIQIGHSADFANKALEALDSAGWDLAEPVLASLVRGIAVADHMEEANAWRHPIDLIAMAEAAFAELPGAMTTGTAARAALPERRWARGVALAEQLLAEDPRANIGALLGALRDGATAEQIAGAVAYAAGLRVARFHTANEFGDWDTVLHTFSFANAIHQAIRRIISAECDRATPEASAEERALPLLRGVVDAAISVYLDRFLNTPPARLPQPAPNGMQPPQILAAFLPLLDRQQQVNEAGELVACYLAAGGDEARLLATLGKALAREERDFHTIQTVEAAFAQHALLRGSPEASHVLIAAARYLAAHAPTVRAQGQTFQIAARLHRGEQLYDA